MGKHSKCLQFYKPTHAYVPQLRWGKEGQMKASKRVSTLKECMKCFTKRNQDQSVERHSMIQILHSLGILMTAKSIFKNNSKTV